MTELEVFAEIKEAFKAYDAQGLIDDISLRRWMKSELKRFGNNIMVYSDDIVQVKNGKGKLPQDFWYLQSAEKYNPSHYECDEESKDILQKSHFWLHTVESTNTFVDGELTNIKLDKHVKEEYYFHDARATLYYTNPEPLKLTKGFNGKAITRDCANLPHKLKHRNCHEINILGDYIQTSFSNGFIYIKYKALPMTEEGEMYIPETQHDRLQNYILSYLEYKVAKQLWLNGDDPNIAQKIQLLLQEKNDNFSLAQTEVKMSTLTLQTWRDIKKMNRHEHRKLSMMFPQQNRLSRTRY